MPPDESSTKPTTSFLRKPTRMLQQENPRPGAQHDFHKLPLLDAILVPGPRSIITVPDWGNNPVKRSTMTSAVLGSGAGYGNAKYVSSLPEWGVIVAAASNMLPGYVLNIRLHIREDVESLLMVSYDQILGDRWVGRVTTKTAKQFFDRCSRQRALETARHAAAATSDVRR